MSNYEKITTGMGEECGVFGAYDMDGGDVAPSVYLLCSTEDRKAVELQ